jgi:hypothetical protein
MNESIFLTKEEFLSETDKRIKELEEAVEFLSRVSGFHTGYLESEDPIFKRNFHKFFGDSDE